MHIKKIKYLCIKHPAFICRLFFRDVNWCVPFAFVAFGCNTGAATVRYWFWDGHKFYYFQVYQTLAFLTAGTCLDRLGK